MKRIEGFFKHTMHVIAVILFILCGFLLVKSYTQVSAGDMTETPNVSYSDVMNNSMNQKTILVFFEPGTDKEKKVKINLQNKMQSLGIKDRPKIVYQSSQSKNGVRMMQRFSVNRIHSLYIIPIYKGKEISSIDGLNTDDINQNIYQNNVVNNNVVASLITGYWRA